MNLKAYFARHAQTLVGSLGRLAAAPFAASMTIGVMAIGIALPLGLYALVQNARLVTADWANALDLSVYLQASASAPRAEAIAKELRGRPDIASVRLIDKDKALREFREYSGFGATLDVLEDNPLPFTLVVTPSLTGATAQASFALRRDIAKMDSVQTVQLDTDWVNRFHAILELARQAVLLAAALLALAVVLIVGNTIRLDVENRRAEIEVMKLVGGSDGFARRPFLYAGIWYGLGGSIAALLLVSAALHYLAAPVSRLAGLYGSDFALQGPGPRIAATVVGLAALLGWLGAWIAATRHIRKIEPS